MRDDSSAAFIERLKTLREQDAGALARLRHSLAFAPGDYPRVFPYVEPFVGSDRHAADAWRLALYAVAGLFALHPIDQPARSLAAALGQFWRDKDRPSLEQRFVAMLEADADGQMNHLRHVVQLLATDGRGFDYAGLLRDLTLLLNDQAWQDGKDRLRRRWARDFYRAPGSSSDEAAAGAPDPQVPDAADADPVPIA